MLIPLGEATDHEVSSSECLKLKTINIAGQSGDPAQICQSEYYTFYCDANSTYIFWSYTNNRVLFRSDDEPSLRAIYKHFEDHSASFVLYSIERLTNNQHRMRSSLTVYPPMNDKSFQFSVNCYTVCGQEEVSLSKTYRLAGQCVTYNLKFMISTIMLLYCIYTHLHNKFLARCSQESKYSHYYNR